MKIRNWMLLNSDSGTGTGAPGASSPPAAAPASGEGAGAGGPSAPSQSDAGSYQAVIDQLRYDFMTEGPQAPATTGTEGASSLPASSTVPPASPPAAPQQDLNTVVGQLSQAVQTLATRPEPQQQQTQQTEPEYPPYQYNIPDQVVLALSGDDPIQKKAALNGLLQGASQTVHRMMRQEVQYVVGQIIPRMIQQAISQSTQVNHVAQDFYGKFPQFNSPELYGLVQQIGTQVAQRMNVQGWTSALRDAIGQEVGAYLARFGGVGAGGGGGQPAPLNGGGVRPQPPMRQDVSNQILDLF